MRSGGAGHTDMDRNKPTTDRGVARFPPATCDSLPCHRPDPARSGRWRVRAPVGPCWSRSRSSTSPTSTIPGSPTTATCGSRRGAWASSGRRGIFIGGGPPVGRRAAGVALPRRARSSSPTPTPTATPTSDVPVYALPEPRDRAGSPACTSTAACWRRPTGPRCPTRRASWPARRRRLLVLEAVNDHENIGALFRNAAAFGVDGVVLDPTAADPLYRRATRVSLGHVLRVPFARADGLARRARRAPRRGLHARGARARGADEPLGRARRRRPRRGSPSCVGAEGDGPQRRRRWRRSTGASASRWPRASTRSTSPRRPPSPWPALFTANGLNQPN